MYKPPLFAELNCSPSRLNMSKPSGAVSQLANQLQDAPKYDGVTIEQMHNNVLYGHQTDSIDKIGLAQKEITKAAKAVSKSKFVRQLNKTMSQPAKPAK